MSLTALAQEALVQAKQLDEYLASQGRSDTSFAEDTLFDLPPNLIDARDNLINVTQTLNRLALGPVGLLLDIMWSGVDQVSLDAVNSFGIARHVPLENTIRIDELARKVKLPSDTVERFLRHAIANRIFTEKGAGNIAHTAASRLLATETDLQDTVSMMAKEVWPLNSKLVEAVETDPECQEPTESAFSLLYEPGVTMWEILGTYPKREAKFGAAMRWFGKFDGWSIKHLVDGFSWEAYDVPGSVFVDVGGGQGPVSRAIAEKTNNMKFIVQDFGTITERGKKLLPAQLEDRVSFVDHDFFSKQPVRDADIYFFRWVLHEWNDKYAVRILKALVPALKVGARIIVFEFLLTDKPETRATEKQPGNTDLVMMGQFNGRERSAGGFARLFEQADPRFVLEDVTRPKGSAMSIIEIVWEGE